MNEESAAPLLIRSSPEALNYTGTPILFFVLRFIKFVSRDAKTSTRDARATRIVVAALVANADSQARKSGRQDLNLRPVAAATALHECIEIVATASGFVIKLSLYRFTTGYETFAVNQDPGNAVLGCFHLTGIVTMKTAGKTFARANIAASIFLTSQNITVEHSDRNISGRQDLNLRPRGPKPRALPS